MTSNVPKNSNPGKRIHVRALAIQHACQSSQRHDSRDQAHVAGLAIWLASTLVPLPKHVTHVNRVKDFGLPTEMAVQRARSNKEAFDRGPQMERAASRHEITGITIDEPSLSSFRDQITSSMHPTKTAHQQSAPQKHQ